MSFLFDVIVLLVLVVIWACVLAFIASSMNIGWVYLYYVISGLIVLDFMR
jgi:hypothetical protein